VKLKNASITLLVSQDKTTIELYDGEARITFLEITLTPEQLSQALSRLAHTKCEIELNGLEKVGKKQEHKDLVFPFEEDAHDWKDRVSAARQEAEKHVEPGWIVDGYFGSRDSFFRAKDGKQYAKTTQRRWVAP
jgi:hypothetical protein